MELLDSRSYLGCIYMPYNPSMSKVATLSVLASGQWGMVTTAQTKMLGVSRLDMSCPERSGAIERLAHCACKDVGVPSDSFVGIRAAWIST